MDFVVKTFLVKGTPVRVNNFGQEFFMSVSNIDKDSYQSGKHRSLFSGIVGHLTNIEGTPTRIEAHPAEIVMCLAVTGACSRTWKEAWQTQKLRWQR